MAKIANVALTNTFDTWRTRSNQAFDRLSQFANNNSSLYANTLTANVSFTSKGLATMQGRATVGTNLTVSGNTTLSKGLTQSGAYATIGGFNAGTSGNSPPAVSGVAFSTNISNGQAEANIWNAADPATYTSTGILLTQYLTSTTRRDLMFLKHNGLVGVGTLSPSYKLDVQGTLGVSTNLTVSGNTTIGAAGKVANATGWFGVNGRQSISTNLFVGGNTYIIGSTAGGGAVGIGTTSPDVKFHVSAPTPTNGILAHLTNSTGSAGTGSFLQITSASVADWAIGQPSGATPSFVINYGKSVGATGINYFNINSSGLVTIPLNLTVTNRITAGNTTLTGTTTDNSNALSQTLTDGATINWDVSLGRVATVTLGAAGRTMAAPTNLKVGTYILRVYQDATGSRTITTWNSVFKWTAAVAPVLSTGANKLDIITFFSDGTNLYGSYLPDMR